VYPDGFFNNTPTWGLSVDRAFKVYKHLVDRGIAPERMQYEGFGRTKPIRDNEKTSEEGQVNRRVEIRILEK
jgi:flagellar motor protein MotB